MNERQVTRRMVLVLATASVAAVACGDSEGTSGSSNSGGAGSGASGPGSGASGPGSGGMGTGGSGASGGMGTGGNAMICGDMFVARGSNYAADPHDLVIPLADFIEGTTKTYTTTMANNHDHDITITDVDFAALANGETVMKYVCPDPGTDHEWVISCADPNVMPTFQGSFGTPGNCPA